MQCTTAVVRAVPTKRSITLIFPRLTVATQAQSREQGCGTQAQWLRHLSLCPEFCRSQIPTCSLGHFGLQLSEFTC